jgi:hypothetical protein
MKLEVSRSQGLEPFTNEHGMFYPFTIFGLLDGQEDAVTMNFKSEAGAPKKGDILEVTVEETKYGKKAKKVQPAFGTQTAGRSPEDQEMIMRQHALDRAIQLFGVKSQFMKKDEVLAVTNAHLFIRALQFVEFYKTGKVSSTTTITPNTALRDATAVFSDQVGEELPDEFSDIERYIGETE